MYIREFMVRLLGGGKNEKGNPQAATRNRIEEKSGNARLTKWVMSNPESILLAHIRQQPPQLPLFDLSASSPASSSSGRVPHVGTDVGTFNMTELRSRSLRSPSMKSRRLMMA